MDFQHTLLDIRRQRLGLIQTAEQLRFSYIAILQAALQDLEIDPSNYDDLVDEEERGVEEEEDEVETEDSEFVGCGEDVWHNHSHTPMILYQSSVFTISRSSFTSSTRPINRREFFFCFFKLSFVASLYQVMNLKRMRIQMLGWSASTPTSPGRPVPPR